MFWWANREHSGSVVEIWVDTRQPLSGRVATGGREGTIPFAGWLELLSILVEELQPDGLTAPDCSTDRAGDSP